MLRVLLPVLLIGWAGEANAQFWRECTWPTWASATVRSFHFDREKDYEEINLGAGLERQCGEDWRVVAGFYRNSFRNDSLYVGATWFPVSWRELRFGVFGGLFTGYEDTPLLPAAALVGAWEGRRYGLNLLLFPPFEESKGLLVLQLKRRF